MHYVVVTGSRHQLICESQMEKPYHVRRGVAGGGKREDTNILP
jgi:hypothetical protein